MLKLYSKFLDRIEKVAGCFVVILLAIAFFIIFAQVVVRYVFKSGYPWMEESARYMIIWMSCLGTAIAVRSRRHMFIDIFVVLLPKKIRVPLNLLFDLMVIAFFIIVIGLGFMYTVRNIDNRSPGMDLSLSVVYLSLVVGMVLSALYAIEQIWKSLIGIFSKEHSQTAQSQDPGLGI